MQDPESVPIHLKLTLSIKEASEYSNIGINKIYAQTAQLSFRVVCRVKEIGQAQGI